MTDESLEYLLKNLGYYRSLTGLGISRNYSVYPSHPHYLKGNKGITNAMLPAIKEFLSWNPQMKKYGCDYFMFYIGLLHFNVLIFSCSF
jgi:hypothetical protein